MVTSSGVLSVGLAHEVEITGRKVGADGAFYAALADDEELFREVVVFVARCGLAEIVPVTTRVDYKLPLSKKVRILKKKMLEHFDCSLHISRGTFDQQTGLSVKEVPLLLVRFGQDTDSDEAREKLAPMDLRCETLFKTVDVIDQHQSALSELAQKQKDEVLRIAILGSCPRQGHGMVLKVDQDGFHLRFHAMNPFWGDAWYFIVGPLVDQDSDVEP
ncbi:hypothetical protein E3J85_01700 [Patescibacteria group bacterium]|nr:MAG: hypothetical protein E3J85_01700 [Patescibacteria group bacterium]